MQDHQTAEVARDPWRVCSSPEPVSFQSLLNTMDFFKDILEDPRCINPIKTREAWTLNYYLCLQKSVFCMSLETRMLAKPSTCWLEIMSELLRTRQEWAVILKNLFQAP